VGVARWQLGVGGTAIEELAVGRNEEVGIDFHGRGQVERVDWGDGGTLAKGRHEVGLGAFGDRARDLNDDQLIERCAQNLGFLGSDPWQVAPAPEGLGERIR
jgi:hypothetical protein